MDEGARGVRGGKERGTWREGKKRKSRRPGAVLNWKGLVNHDD
jgi:hypothetical protein